jgi:hypothetical protein
MEKSRLNGGFCLPGKCPSGTLYQRPSSFGTGSLAPFRTLCALPLRREDHIVEAIGFLATTVIFTGKGS